MKIISIIKIAIMVVLATSFTMGSVHAAGSGKLNNLPELYTVYVGPTTLTVAGKESRTGAMAFGGLGAGFAAQKTGKKMIKDYSLEEPLVGLRNNLVSNLKKKYSIKKVYGKNKAYKKSEVGNDALKKRYGNAVVLKLKPQKWWLSEYPFSKKYYYVHYYANAEIISLADGKSLWKGRCKTQVKPKDKKTAPSIHKLRENNAAMFKSWTVRLTKECADWMSEDIAKKL